MAPYASDPKDLKLLLNPARRRALAKLLEDIIAYMRTKIEQSFETRSTSNPEIGPPHKFVPPNTTRPPSFGDPEAEARQRRLEARLEESYSNPKLRQLKRDVLFHFDRWANEVKGALGKACEGPEDPRSEQRRREWMAARNPAPPPYTASSLASKDPEAESKELEYTEDASLLQTLYHPIPTRLTTISKDDRLCTVSCMVLVLLSLGHYSSYSRTLLCYLTSSFCMPLSILTTEETEIAQTLMLASKTLTADAETQKRQAENASSRRWKVGLASIAGAAVIGITGGLAAPVVAGAIGGIMGGVGLGGVASFLGVFFMNGALVGTLFGAFGGKMTGEMIDQYAKEVSDFKFLPIAGEWGELSTKEDSEIENRRLRVTIGVNGWLKAKDDVAKPWRVLGRESEVFALRYEIEALLDLGNSMQTMVTSYAWSYVKMEILKRTVLATLWYALWPIAVLKMAASIDNPFSVAKIRSEKAGEVLADALINKAQGERPVTLIGYSLGSRVIYSCLKSLAERKAFGLIESVVFIGAPVPSDSNNWKVMRSVVSGRIINVYSENDYILAFLYRATSIQLGVAGLQAIGDVEGIDNLNLSKEVSGHLRYPDLIGKILKRAGFEGILVDDTEIEGDVTEIQLLDTDTKSNPHGDDLLEMMDTAPIRTSTRAMVPAVEPKVLSSKYSHQQDLLGLFGEEDPKAIAGPSLAAELSADNGIDDLTRGMAGMGMNPSFKLNKQTTNPLFDFPAMQTRPSMSPNSSSSYRSAAQLIAEMDTPVIPPTPLISSNIQASQPKSNTTEVLFDHREERLRRGMLDITDGLAMTQIEDLPNDDSDSEDGGIQMLDNESDSDTGELRMVEGLPIPDDEDYDGSNVGKKVEVEEDPRDRQKFAGFFEEQKSLGGLVKGNVGVGSSPGAAGSANASKGKVPEESSGWGWEEDDN